ncbi:P-loop containing nucleoside triphosphate hydrolase protein [Xylariaceae sp. FL1651]|nr:P-loop containing nucleoside triphosphate hydrolase protein [Xylariaceae sp. FL1651]
MAPAQGQFGSRCEFKTYHTTPNKDGHLKVKQIIDPFNSNAEVKQGTDKHFALVINRVFSSEDQTTPKSVTLDVNSPHLLKTFKTVIGSYPTVGSNFNSRLELKSPFQMLIHYWEELEDRRYNCENADERMHLALLFQFMEFELGPERRKLLAMLDRGQISYHTAWAIFRPGDLLYTEVMGQGWLLRCTKTAYEESKKIGPYLEVHCTCTDHDGNIVGQAEHIFLVRQKQSFGGDNPAYVTDLPVYPRSYIKDDNLEEKLEARGEVLLKHREWSVQMYDGLAQYLKEPPTSWWDYDMANADPIWLPYTETGRIVLDSATFRKDYNRKAPGISRAKPVPMLCPPFALGYSLAKKTWCRFLITNISTIQWKKEMWDRLILDDERKQVVKALVASHRYPDNPRNQPEQKGKGLVILLHGSPGSGKTLTAEASAELTGKALISCSMASLNEENVPWLFERNLQKLLQYAASWQAIVLLDEADVFLEERKEQAGNAERNALVAVFLKELEYFAGIVFLTTNRLRSFDWAMKSRIHLALGFSPPDVVLRRQFWAQCLSIVPKDEVDIQDVEDAAIQLADISINGREISNAVNTARTLATFEGEKLQLVHVQKILKTRKKFEETLAFERKIMDAFTPKRQESGLMRRGSILTEEPEEYGYARP